MFRRNDLINDVEEKLYSNENRTVTLMGVNNLTTSDLETILIYATSSPGELMKPLGNVRKVLEKYGYCVAA